MDLKLYLFKLPRQKTLVSFQNREVEIERENLEKGYNFIINNDILYIDKKRWSLINMKENDFSERYFYFFINLCDEINNFFYIKFCIFSDNLLYFNYHLSIVSILKNKPHPIEEFGFKADEPNFPFTENTDLMKSNIYYHKEFMDKIMGIIRKQTIPDFVEMCEKSLERKHDSLSKLTVQYKNINVTIGEFVDNINDIDNFYLAMEECFKLLDFLPQQYIKIY
jgi:hypothetical protein